MRPERRAWTVAIAAALATHAAVLVALARPSDEEAGGAGRPQAVSGISESDFLQLAPQSNGSDDAAALEAAETADAPDEAAPDAVADSDPDEIADTPNPARSAAPVAPEDVEQADTSERPDESEAVAPIETALADMTPVIPPEAATADAADTVEAPAAVEPDAPQAADPSDVPSEAPAAPVARVVAEPVDAADAAHVEPVAPDTPAPAEPQAPQQLAAVEPVAGVTPDTVRPITPDALDPMSAPETEATPTTEAAPVETAAPAEAPTTETAEAVAAIETEAALEPVPEIPDGEFEGTRLPRGRPDAVPETVLRDYERQQRLAEAARAAEARRAEAARQAEAARAAERRKRRERAATETAGRANHAPARARASPPPSPGAPVGFAGHGDEGPSRGAISSYTGRVYAHLARHKRFPDGTRDRGRATVTFTVSAAGAASGIRLAKSSGSAALDQAALAMVSRASPFPPIPSDLRRKSMTFTVPIDFSRR